METSFKIKLKDHWDFSQSPDPNVLSGEFWGREDEVDALKQMIRKKTRTVILLCGQRGRGKTSLISKVIRETRESEVLIIPIFIDAPQLDAKKDSDGRINYLGVLENIVNRLYASCKKPFRRSSYFGMSNWLDFWQFHGFKNKLKGLHEKNLAARWSKEETTTFIKEKSRFALFFKSRIGFWVTIFVVLLLFATSFFDFRDVKIVLVINDNLIWVIRAMLAIFSVSVVIVRSRHESTESFLYERSFGSLEHFFKSLFDRNFKKIKFVFIVDELDFFMLDNNADASNTVVLSLLKAYKNLLHSINAVFIFAGDHGLYRTISKQDGNLFSTIFTDVVYLPVPKQLDLFDYLGRIVHEDEDIKDANAWELVRYYLMYCGKGDFRKTIAAVKGYIKHGNMFIMERGNFRIQEVQAMAYRLMADFYDSVASTNSMEQHINDELFERLYQCIQPKVWSAGGIPFPARSDDPNEEYIKQQQKHFLDCLQEFEIIEVKDDGKTLKGRFVQNIPRSINIFTPNEVMLRDEYNAVLKNVEELLSQLNRSQEEVPWLESVANIQINAVLDEAEKKIKQIEYDIELVKEKKSDGYRKLSSQEELEPLRNALKSMKGNLVSSRFSFMKAVIFKFSASAQGSLKDSPHLFGVVPRMREALQKERHSAFYLPNNYSKQLVVIDRDDVNEYRKEIESANVPLSYRVVGTNDWVKGIMEDWFCKYELDGKWSDWYVKTGVPQVVDDHLKLNMIKGVIQDNSGELNTFLLSSPRKDVVVSGSLECEIKLPVDSMLNFVIGFSEFENRQQYWIARVSASSAPTDRSGILFKKYGEKWDYSRKSQATIKTDEWLRIKLIFDAQRIELYKLEERNGEMRQLLISKVMNKMIDSGRIGLFNERGEVLIRNVILKKHFSDDGSLPL